MSSGAGEGEGGPNATGVPRSLASTARLYSSAAYSRIQAAHVAVVGLGGVGSWAVEALARSGVGRITLIDTDHVAEGNLNRQVQALRSSLGMAKGAALKARIADMQPTVRVDWIDDFLSPENLPDMLACGADIWIDACDDRHAKLALISAFAWETRAQRLIVSGGAGGKTDPSRVQVADITRAEQDPLLARIRQFMRQKQGAPRKGNLQVPAVFCTQNPVQLPEVADCDPAARLACAGYGSSVVVTATMGIAAASWALETAARGAD